MSDPLLDRIAFAVAVFLVFWLIGGRQWNRRRAVQLARAARDAMRLLGDDVRVQPLGGGTGGFLMEVGRPGAGIRSAQLLCLLEPRDFPLAWAWTRWRGRRPEGRRPRHVTPDGPVPAGHPHEERMRGRMPRGRAARWSSRRPPCLASVARPR